MANLPPELPARLDDDVAAALDETIDAIGEELAVVYAQTCSDHRPARGDNSQVFGLKVWTRGDFRITGRLADVPLASVVHINGSYHVALDPLTLGVYKLGHTVDDDIHHAFPDESPTKRGYAERNAAQLSLFDVPVESRLPEDRRYELNDLLVAHFGNPRDGLAKWYVGATVTDDEGLTSWAWTERQDLPGEGVLPDTQTPPIVPFDSRESPPLVVKPRQRSTGT